MEMKTKEDIKNLFLDKVQTKYGISLEDTTRLEKYVALSSAVKDYIYRKWVKTNKRYNELESKQAYYFSIEFLSGKQLGTNLNNLGIYDMTREALKDLGVDLHEVEAEEHDLGLGNGGLGRLGSCFLESLASLDYPGHGCTIRYKYGLFKQRIIDRQQVEILDNWLENGNVWEVRKPNRAVEIKFGGNVRTEDSNDGRQKFILENYQKIYAVPYDMPVVGYGNENVNTLRLFNAETGGEVDYTLLTAEEVERELQYERSVETISQMLYPDDAKLEGKMLRLKQEYFLSSAGVQTIIAKLKRRGADISKLDELVAIHLNDTHPVVTIPELMRILIDEEGYGWDEAWNITSKVISFTNHTIMPEAFEKWDVNSFKELLPRVYMIVEEIDRRFRIELQKAYPYDQDRVNRMAIISDGRINMAHLAIAGSHSVNGVAEVHTKILKTKVMRDFFELYPEKFNNKTNGVTHRSWLLKSNPSLSRVITDAIGDNWIKEPWQLNKLLEYKDDSSFQEEIFKAKRHNKVLLAELIKARNGIDIDVDSIVDVQVKRVHEYKRQLLNIFHILDMYYKIKDNPNIDLCPRTFVFGGKAAPGYYMAKRVINLMASVADMINSDKGIRDLIKVVPIEDYKVSIAERIFPASDISEQISTASKEASGTGNMKFMLNGAITMGTLDGANIEIFDAVGEENFFRFGMTVDEVLGIYERGGYSAFDIYKDDFRVKRILENLVNGNIPGSIDGFRKIYDSLVYNNDQFFVLKDFDDYIKAQSRADEAYKDQSRWRRMSIVNIGNAGMFSSDRTIREYANEIWHIDRIVDHE